jgi:SAM-dependent methyltransferase
LVTEIEDERGRRGLRQRLFAFAYRSAMSDSLMGEVADHKRRLLKPLRGTIVEFGPGTGANFDYLDAAAIDWIGVEPNLFMHPALLHEAERHGVRGQLTSGTAEATGLPDACADAVISTHVMCSVEDTHAAYLEALRLLKPGGIFAFVDHVGAPRGSLLRRVQRLIRPVWSFAADGCRPDRDLEASLRAAGFAAVDIAHFSIAAPIVSPHIAGRAIKKNE